MPLKRRKNNGHKGQSEVGAKHISTFMRSKTSWVKQNMLVEDMGLVKQMLCRFYKMLISGRNDGVRFESRGQDEVSNVGISTEKVVEKGLKNVRNLMEIKKEEEVEVGRTRNCRISTANVYIYYRDFFFNYYLYSGYIYFNILIILIIILRYD